jgi:hypothetical protein
LDVAVEAPLLPSKRDPAVNVDIGGAGLSIKSKRDAARGLNAADVPFAGKPVSSLVDSLPVEASVEALKKRDVNAAVIEPVLV